MPAPPISPTRCLAMLAALLLLGAEFARAEITFEDFSNAALAARSPSGTPAATPVALAEPPGPGSEVSAILGSPFIQFDSGVLGRRLGVSTATAGDVNGDGFSDIVALGVGYTGPTAFYLFFGGATGLTLAPGFPIMGLPQYASMACGVGDLDGNGLADVAIGFPASNGGGFRVFFGRDGTLDMAHPFVVTSPKATYGTIVGPAGDVNGDGVDDMVVGSPGADNVQFYCALGFSGQVDVYFGAAGTGPSAANVWFVPGCLWTGTDSEFGSAVGAAGDVNGDGVDDLVIGAASATSGAFPDGGKVFVLHGSASGLPMDPVRAGIGALTGATVLESSQDLSRFGATAITAGDVNGDGFADVAVGAPEHDHGAPNSNTGLFSVFAGSAGGIQPGTVLFSGVGSLNERLGRRVMPAGDLNGDGRADLLAGGMNSLRLFQSTGATLTNINPSFVATLSDFSFCTAGDVNGDGLSDMVLGDPGITNPMVNEGRLSVFLGRGERPSTSPNWTFSSGLTNPNLGWSVSSAGDVNGDGFDDYLVGAPTLPNIAMPGETDNGGVFLNYGSVAGPTPGFSDWSYVGAAGDQVGIAVAPAGDINGDGFGDIMAGAHQPGTGNGKVLIWYGRSGGLPGGAPPDVTLNGPVFGGQFGAALSSGDFNGDGYADIAVGAPMASRDTPPGPEAGRVLVYVGSSAGLVTTPVFTRVSGVDFVHLGESLAADADLNGDGYTDLVIGAPDADEGGSNSGHIEVWGGHASGPGESPVDFAAALIGAAPGERFGHHLANAGDVNGDGRSDIVFGMPLANGMTGRAAVHAGAERDDPSGSWISLQPLWTQNGFQAGAAFGSSVSSAGDLNGDGLSDIIVGSVFEEVDFVPAAGMVRAFLGPLPAGAPATWPTWGMSFPDAHFGHAATLAGDVNGDGWSDLLIAEPGYSSTLFRQGRCLLYFGAGGIGRLNLTLPTRNDGRRIALRGLADAASFRLTQVVVTAAGRTRVRMQARVQLPKSFPGSANPVTHTQSFFTPTGAPGSLGSGAVLFNTIPGLAAGGPYAWQARALTRSIYFPSTRWVSPTRNGALEYDLRSPGTWVGIEDAAPVSTLELAAPWPNPTSAGSRITFDLPRPTDVALEVLDLQGRRVRTLVHGMRATGRQHAAWDGRDEHGAPAGAGVYFYRLAAAGATRTRRVVLIP